MLHGLSQGEAHISMNWNSWRLIGIGGLSMLSVLFVVIWQAVSLQQARVLALNARLNQLEQPQDGPSIKGLERQLQSLQSRLEDQEELLDKVLEIEGRIIKLERADSRLFESRQWQIEDKHKPANEEAWD